LDTEGVIQLLILFFLLLLSAFFSSAETALSSVSRAALRAMEEEGKKNAKMLSKVLNDYDRMLSTILVGNNIVNLSASSLATIFTMKLFGNAYVSLSTGILTFLVLIFGEIVPKTWARRNAKKVSLFFSYPIRFFMVILFPIVVVVNAVSGFILFIFRQGSASDHHITESELRSYVDVSKEDGAIEEDEHDIINNVFDFRDSVAKDIMIPRIDMTSISIDATYKEVMKVFRESMYTRLPVYKEEKENIVGFINIKDLIRLKDSESFKVSKYLRNAYYTYEYKKTNDLMLEMRKASMNLTFVNNEYGETVGMITLEDLLEEIVGEIRDEYDADEERQIVETEDGFLIEARMKLEDINDSLGTDFKSEDYDSIGGLILDQLDRIPSDQEEVTLPDGTLLKVCGIKQNRIVKVLVKLPEKEAEDVDSE
jgi:CBS domain containing-hemolysin-like protein